MIRLVELAKYNLDEATISAAPAITQWAFYFLRADRYEAARSRYPVAAAERKSFGRRRLEAPNARRT